MSVVVNLITLFYSLLTQASLPFIRTV